MNVKSELIHSRRTTWINHALVPIQYVAPKQHTYVSTRESKLQQPRQAVPPSGFRQHNGPNMS